jgi:hypothetical protein
VLDDRLPVPGDLPPRPTPPWDRYLAFVRAGPGLQNHLSHAYRLDGPVARQVRTLELPERLEGAVRATAADGADPSRPGRWEETQAAVLAWSWERRARVPDWDRGGPVVLLVRDPLTRRAVRDHLAGELPTLAVVARGELRPDVELVPADAAPSPPDTSAMSPRPPGRRPRLNVRRSPHVQPRRDRQPGDPSS